MNGWITGSKYLIVNRDKRKYYRWVNKWMDRQINGRTNEWMDG